MTMTADRHYSTTHESYCRCSRVGAVISTHQITAIKSLTNFQWNSHKKHNITYGVYSYSKFSKLAINVKLYPRQPATNMRRPLDETFDHVAGKQRYGSNNLTARKDTSVFISTYWVLKKNIYHHQFGFWFYIRCVNYQ
jgi:hypothetical protein